MVPSVCVLGGGFFSLGNKFYAEAGWLKGTGAFLSGRCKWVKLSHCNKRIAEYGRSGRPGCDFVLNQVSRVTPHVIGIV